MLLLSNRQPKRASKGNALVEFALVIMLLLTIVMGLIDYSFAFLNQMAITNASREGARTGVRYVPRLGGETQETWLARRCARSQQVAVNYAGVAGLVSFGSKGPATAAYTNYAKDGRNICRVEVSYNYTGLFFFLGGKTLQGVSEMTYEF
jgi:Flp pilus assembly protein TadG